jgi:hypothetical protein
VIVVIGGVVRKMKRRKRVLAKPTTDTRLINDSTNLSNLTRKPMAEPTWSRPGHNRVVT